MSVPRLKFIYTDEEGRKWPFCLEKGGSSTSTLHSIESKKVLMLRKPVSTAGALVVVRDAYVCVSPDNNIEFLLSMVSDNCNRDIGEDKGFVGQVPTSTNSSSTSPTTSSSASPSTSSPTSPPTLPYIDPATFPSPNPSVATSKHANTPLLESFTFETTTRQTPNEATQTEPISQSTIFENGKNTHRDREVDFIPVTHILPNDDIDTQKSREVEFVPVTHILPNDDKDKVEDLQQQSQTIENKDESKQTRQVKFFPTTHYLRSDNSQDHDYVEESVEMEHLVGDPTFVKRKQNPPAERGKFEEVNQINQEVIKRQRQDSREVVDKGHQVSQELLKRDGEVGQDYNGERAGNFQVEKQVMNRPSFVEVPRVPTH